MLHISCEAVQTDCHRNMALLHYVLEQEGTVTQSTVTIWLQGRAFEGWKLCVACRGTYFEGDNI